LDAQLNDVSQQLTEVKVTGSKKKYSVMEEQVPKLLLEGKNYFVANNIKVSG
jgi:hypothetical protein